MGVVVSIVPGFEASIPYISRTQRSEAAASSASIPAIFLLTPLGRPVVPDVYCKTEPPKRSVGNSVENSEINS